jgi:hypothetical protein
MRMTLFMMALVTGALNAYMTLLIRSSNLIIRNEDSNFNHPFTYFCFFFTIVFPVLSLIQLG